MPSRIPILFLTNRFAAGGAETFLLSRIRHLDRDRFAPHVGALRPGGVLREAFEREGVPAVEFGGTRRFDPRSFAALYAYLREHRIELLEAHVRYACVVARVVGTLARVPAIVTNEQDVHRGADPIRKSLRWASDATTPLSDARVYITRATEATYLAGTPARLQTAGTRRVIPNGVEVDRIAAVAAGVDRAAKRAELGLPADAFVIGNVARLVPMKGQRYLLDAFARLAPEMPDARVALVGSGHLEAALRAQAASLGVAERVHFLGRRLDVQEVLATFDVFAFPSVAEAQGIAVLEAMSAGVPVVAAASDGLPEMVRDGTTGLLVPARDGAALADAIARLRSDDALRARLAAGALAMARAEFDVAAIARAYESLYDELLRSRRRAA